jgi:hypothetical protein
MTFFYSINGGELYPNGDPVLMIRANNPSKNLLRKVDAEDLVVQFADHVKSLTRPEATTDGKPFRYIVLPLDHNSESSTNRQEVNEAIWMLYGNAEKLELVDEPETNFNDYYDNWNSQGAYPCGIIYENTDKIDENTDVMTQKEGVESQGQPRWFSELLDQFRTARTKRAS